MVVETLVEEIVVVAGISPAAEINSRGMTLTVHGETMGKPNTEREKESVTSVARLAITRLNVGEVKAARRWVPGAHRNQREPVCRRESKCVT